ncbi:MAG: NAD(P)-dependent oxidoreductase [Roseiflexaceae bacterium]|nr:NAD(P)-dependent oxidoreductase [Roseiflexaceae bacterium]
MQRVLITGAGGEIGRALRAGLYGHYPALRLLDIKPQEPPRAGEELLNVDVTDLDATSAALKDVDCVVHLAGIPREDTWATILPNNIVGTYNVFEAARLNRVKRLIFASSNHAVGYHPTARAIGIDVQPRPDSRYGVSKVFGEALGRMYADKHGLSVACLRIGSYRERPQDKRQLSTWISPRDMVQLTRRCIDAPDYHFLVAYGVSANTRNRWVDASADILGYRPQDNAEEFAAELAGKAPPPGDPARECHGGPFCALEFTGDLSKID